MWANKKARTAIIKSIPAPTKGLNDFDSIANMDPTFALDMLNMFPSAKSLKVRNGYKEWMTGFSGPVKTLMVYNANNGANKLFACTDIGIFDATSSGAAGAPVVSLTNGYTSYVNYSNVAGQYLISVNGADMGQLYDGTSWIPMSTIGASTQDMSMVTSYNKRLWFAEKNSMTAWYLPVDAISGTLTPFYLGPIFKMGGFLQNIFTWTLDSGDGMNDVLIFQSNKGEIAGYVGTDPSAVATWDYQANYFVGAPLGDRTTEDLGGDVAMLTIGGIVPISKVVGGTQAISKDGDTLSKNISKTFNDLITTIGQSPNWEIKNFPTQTALYVNFPATGGTDATQFVMNTLTGAWTKYDYPIRTMAEHNQTLYFSDELGRIHVVDPTNNLDAVDILGTSGQFIVSGCQTAYNYFELLGTNKTFGLIRPLFISQYAPSILTNVSVDFNPNSIAGVPSPAGGPTSVDFWDTALWDVNLWFAPNAPTQSDVWDTGIWDETIWSPPVNAQYQWIGVGQMGYAASLAIKLATNAPTEFVSCDWSLTPGLSL